MRSQEDEHIVVRVETLPGRDKFNGNTSENKVTTN
ncbi:hypothetical protein FOQG_00284 [Fusarium oxysporum f. sp. raphani 54005]|uniref:Uncharacterized protein n=6 Tax=Fusarium oxysporum TaxID=5507 RepID=X0D9S6_FUSOX|nr:hypothetical protein FOXG_18131 [Fusarium oxysporum f. sp. lycopersici 4287]EXA50711.1 hypothetical protein FOVG_03292 [Fusarium oxysporum f. sp. pisi HDV247]EXK42846.1 hypothetical protein FOMG_05600 [Fusarium oxysporum f. sp. melonis 26406]EXK99904.1 hypothetical protein FOQG_00284 [Fusarium oxysporum f. sp. raphani 54005]EXL82239.1 hypothetical protein FOPG_04837 [Fusarium oxysporum f. sp. conglutinans race 2 54008]EXM35909.1 hypothetical protein FOTG_00272 [Fusarium oxysporum f. sp. vas